MLTAAFKNCMYSMWLHVLYVGMCDETANLFILPVMNLYRPPGRGGLVLSGSVPFLMVSGTELERFQNHSGP